MTSAAADGWLIAGAVRWITLVALALALGALVLELQVMPAQAPALTASRRRLRRWVLGGVLVLMATTVGHLIIRAQVMSGGASLGAAITVVPLVLRRTQFGTWWIIRGALLMAATVAASFSTRSARWWALALLAGIAATTGLTGHAADWGDLTLSVGVDVVHIWAASAWTGGLMALTVAVLNERSRWPPDLLPDVARRFSVTAGWCLALVAASGIYNAVVQVSTPAALVRTAYGRVLIAKIMLVLGLAALGAVSRYGAVAALRPGTSAGLWQRLFCRAFPRLAQSTHRPPAVALSRYVAGEAVLALIVFGCTAVLGDSMPARHAIKMQHQQTTDDTDGESREAPPAAAHDNRH